VNRRCSQLDSFCADITLTCTNNGADQINRDELQALPSRECSFEGRIEGQFRIEEDKLPSPLDLRLKVGARIMFTKNDQQRRWVNGTLGIVQETDQGSIRVKLVSGSRRGGPAF
jgi:hypothetical protein